MLRDIVWNWGRSEKILGIMYGTYSTLDLEVIPNALSISAFYSVSPDTDLG
jgi:hypothetical protein